MLLLTALPFIFLSSIQTESKMVVTVILFSHVCIPPYPPDLNFNDISNKNFEVLLLVPHGFDCE
jgi:hypothetical protein